MNRIQILQKIIDENNYKIYLEIGTFQGESLLPLKCKIKIAVDPNFQISKKNKLRWMWKNPCNITNQYFEMTSDKFFESQKTLLTRDVDLVFIDGLHTFKASLIDTLNSLNNLSTNGYIVLHDCYPPNEAAATPAESIEAADKLKVPGWKMEWCGDVWKTIVYLREEYKGILEITVIDIDYGLGIIRKKTPHKTFMEINLDHFNKINSLSYNDLKLNHINFLNLKSTEYLDQI